MKKIAYSFISTHQLSAQEAVYNILPELWLRKCQPEILFINTNLQENRIRSKEELEVLSDDSTDAFKRNIIDRYMDRPKNGKFACLKNVCLAQFASYYYRKSTSENDYQPKILEEGIEGFCHRTSKK